MTYLIIDRRDNEVLGTAISLTGARKAVRENQTPCNSIGYRSQEAR